MQHALTAHATCTPCRQFSNRASHLQLSHAPLSLSLPSPSPSPLPFLSAPRFACSSVEQRRRQPGSVYTSHGHQRVGTVQPSGLDEAASSSSSAPSRLPAKRTRACVAAPWYSGIALSEQLTQPVTLSVISQHDHGRSRPQQPGQLAHRHHPRQRRPFSWFPDSRPTSKCWCVTHPESSRTHAVQPPGGL